MRCLHLLILLALGLSLSSARAQNTNAFELRDGDRVLLIGDTLIEREQAHGYVEHMLTTHFPDRHVIFRNLGWSADTPQGQSRVSFDWSKSPDDWFKHLMGQVDLVKPTVVFLGYGMANSFDGEAGLAKFTADLQKLMDGIQKQAGETKVRFVLLSPIRHEKLPAPLPDPAKHNELLTLYTKALKELAAKRDAHFVPLFELLDNSNFPPPVPPLTDNGIHLTAYGYRRAAEALAIGLNWNPNAWRVGTTREGTVRNGSYGAQVIETERKEDSARLVALAEQLVPPPWTGTQSQPRLTPPCRWQVMGIKPGTYDLKIDGQFIKTVTDQDMRNGLPLESGPQFDQAEELRQAILKKNELFFHRWRPENSTYLFLFRKHEQGQNAKEIPQFDPLIEDMEKKIATLRKPVKHTYEIVFAANQNAAPAQAADQSKPKRAVPPITDKPQTPFRPQAVPVFQTDPNIEVSLFAENPQLAKPIHMNFDARGRLWVASSSVYPQIAPGQTADDRILILEDTDNDGKADQTTVFADGLLIPTGVEPGDGGAYVAHSTELLHFKDTDGDGVADQHRVVLSGFGTEDTHHILHTLRWGHDGQLYMNQSIYIHSHIETPHGVVRLNSGGTLALRPDTLELGVTMKGLVNGWGHDFDDFGQSFQTDGAGGQGINWNIPQAMYVTYAGARRILGSVSPGSYPKFCGLELVKSEHFPKEWQGNAITCDFRANRVVRFEIEEQGAGYVTKQHELMRTTNITFRPIDVKLGPDGALYIADWSNPIIQHGEVDFRDPRRDRVHGRIWRVAYKGGKKVAKPELVKASNTELLNQLLSPNGFNEDKARRVLLQQANDERTRSQLAFDISAWENDQFEDQRVQLQALWLWQGLDAWTAPYFNSQKKSRPFGNLERLLASEDGRVRAAAVRVLGTLAGNTPGIPSLAKPRIDSSPALDLLAKRITDDHPRVRLEALRSLARIPTARSAELALSVLDQGPVEGFLEYALWLTINDLAEPWAAAVESGAWKIEGREKQLQYALKSIEPKLASGLMAKVIGDKPLPRDGSGGLIELIGQAGGPAQLRQLFDAFLAGMDTPAAVRALNALSEAARLRNAKPSGDLAALGRHVYSQTSVHAAALRLMGSWKLATFTPDLVRIAENSAQPEDLRRAAIEGLREVGGKEASAGLRGLTSAERDFATRRRAAAALASTDLNGSMPQILGVISATTKEDEALALWRSLLGAKGASAAFTKALATATLPEPAARAGLRAAREGGRNEPNLVLALNRAGGLSDGNAALTDDEIHAIAYEVTKGKPDNGERIYRRKELGCVLCHAIGGAGGKVGPDMSSLGTTTPVADYLVESVLLPNKRVKEGYNSVQVTLKDGEELSGNLVRETTEELILRDATAREVSIPKRNIQSRKMGGSLMPAGLVDHLAPQDRLDLYAFLARLGKPGPFDASGSGVARVWRVNPTAPAGGDANILKSDVTAAAWVPVFTTVAGGLLKDDLLNELASKTQSTPFFAATRFQTGKAGPVKLKISGLGSPKAWIDGQPVGGNTEMTADLPGGIHTFIVKLDPQQLPEQIRLETADGSFLVE